MSFMTTAMKNEEDYDFAQLNYAVELQIAIVKGTYVAKEHGDDMTECLQIMCQMILVTN